MVILKTEFEEILVISMHRERNLKKENEGFFSSFSTSCILVPITSKYMMLFIFEILIIFNLSSQVF